MTVPHIERVTVQYAGLFLFVALLRHYSIKESSLLTISEVVDGVITQATLSRLDGPPGCRAVFYEQRLNHEKI